MPISNASSPRRARSIGCRRCRRAAVQPAMPSPKSSAPVERIRSRQARIGVIGLGYVGLPLAVEFARAGFDVTGFDVDDCKVVELNAGRSYIGDVSTDDLSGHVKAKRLRGTTDMSKLAEMDIVDICVPT